MDLDSLKAGLSEVPAQVKTVMVLMATTVMEFVLSTQASLLNAFLTPLSRVLLDGIQEVTPLFTPEPLS